MAETIRIEIPIETIDKTDPGLSQATDKLKKFDATVKQIQQSVKQGAQQVSSSMSQMSNSMSSASKSAGQAKERVSAFDKAAEKTQKSLMSWMKQKYELVLEAKDKISPIVSKISSGIKTFAGKTWHVTLKALDLVTSPIRKILNLLKSPLLAAGLTLSLGAGLISTGQSFAGFEASMSQVQAISGATGDEFEQLTAKAKEMGATTKFTATQSAEAFNYMSMAGWKTKDMLDGIEGIMNLAAASGEDLGTTSDIVTDALTAFNLTAKDSTHFADVLAQASANANTNVGKMGQTFQYVAPVAGAMGYRIEDTALAIGLMANAGIKGEKAGTQLRAIFSRLVNPPKEAAEAIESLRLSVANADGTMRPLNDVMGDLRKSFAGLTDEQKTQYASALAGQEAMSGLLAIVNASEDDYNKLAEAVNNADGASKRMSGTMLDNLAGKFTLFKSALDGVKISLGARFKPYLEDALEWLTAKMPDVESALMRGMDRVDEFIDNTKEKIKEFTGTAEWENADIFGKIKISWDELIGKPFSSWWANTGRALIAEKAGDIGNGIGTAINHGILALFGIDAGNVMNEGAEIGRQFASGFTSGLDFGVIKDKLWEGMGNLFSSAGKLIPGGKEADLSSLLSAALIAKIAAPLLSLGGKGISLGKGIIGSGKDGVLKKVIGKFSVADELAGVGTATGSGLLGLLGKTGMALGSGAATAGGLALAGGGAIAGGFMGGATLISGAKDFYKAYKSKDADEQSTAIASGGLKVGGVASGAALGAMIGSIVPVLGTGIGALIGAGIGGIAGNFGAGKVEQNYQDRLVAAEKTKYALEGAKFASKELDEAFKDSSVTAEEFGNMMQKSVGENLESHFGNIKLSMGEIKDIAKQITFGDQEKSFNAFTDATNQAKNSLQTMQSAVATMDKLNWKASLGMQFSETDIESYKAGIDNLIQSAQTYLEDRHYEAKAAIDLLIEPGGDVDMTSGLNSMYAGLQEQINSLGGQLQAKVEVALEDGVITLDEQAEITNLQNQITAITDQIAQSDMEATFQMMKVKYDGAALDYESFAALQTEIQSQVETMSQGYDQAYKVAVSNLQLQLQNGAINQEQFDSQLQALTQGYEAKLKELTVRVESFQLDAIASAYGTELDGILPELEGTTAEKLGQAMHNAMSQGWDGTNWDLSQIVDAFGLENLEGTTQNAIAERMGQVVQGIPQQVSDALANTDMSAAGSGLQEGITNSLSNGLEGADFGPVAQAVTNNLGNALGNVDFSESGSGLQEGLANSLTSSLENVDLSPVANTLTAKLGESMANIDMSESGGGLQEGLAASLSSSLEGMDMTPVTSALNTSLTAALAEADMTGVTTGLQESITAAMSSLESIDMTGLSSGIASGLQSEISAIDYSPIGTSVGTGVANAITSADMGQINSAIQTLKSNVGSAINSAFSGGFTTTTTVTITIDYKLANPSATISFSGGGSGTATVSGSIASNAEGSIVGGPLLSWVGEDGPEAIIPLGSKRRSRGLSLWKQAGEMLGVLNNANGSIIGKNSVSAMTDENLQYISNVAERAPEAVEQDGEEAAFNVVPVASQNEQKEPQELKIDVNISVNPKFEISGSGDEENVVRIIKAHIREMADEIGDEMAEKLSDVFSNMPVSVQ